MRRLVLLLCLLASACEGSDGLIGPTIELIDPDGDNAARDVAEGSLSVAVRQESRVICDGDGDCVAPIANGDFSLVLPIGSLQAPTELQLRITGGEQALFGATPAFLPFGEGIDLLAVRPVMLPAMTCRVIDPPALTTSGALALSRPRRDVAAIPRANLVLLAGGVEESGPSARVDRFDQVVTEMLSSLAPTEATIGPARGVTLRDDGSQLVSFVVGDGSSWRFVSQMGPPAAERVTTLHAEAGFASTLVRLDRGAAVVGGADGDGAAVDQVSWVDELGAITAIARTTVPRAFSAAAFVGGEVVVVGGGTAERLERGGAGAAIALEGLPDGVGGALTASPDGAHLLYVGFDVDGAPSAETHILRGCPDACTREDGPAWPSPRPGAAFLRTEAGVLWIVGGEGSDEVDRVVWDGSTPRFERGPTLAEARTGAAAFEQASGIVTVVGGEGPEGLSRSVEQCMPAGLDAFD